MNYRLDLTLGAEVAPEQLEQFLAAVAGTIPAAVLAENDHRWEASGWIRHYEGDTVTCRQVYDGEEWAAIGTAQFLALLRLAADPVADIWATLPNRALGHHATGVRLYARARQIDPWVPLFRIPEGA